MDKNNEPGGELKEIAGGWMTERKGMPVPAFLKVAYVGFSLFGLAYLFLYRDGELGQPSRGPLVAQFNELSEKIGTGPLVVIGLLLAAYIALLMWAGFSKVSPEE